MSKPDKGEPQQQSAAAPVVNAAQYALYTLLTCCSLVGMCSLLLAAGFPAFRAALQACGRWGMWAALPVLPAIWLAWGGVLCVVVALCNKVLLPGSCMPGGRLQLYSMDHVRWWTTHRLLHVINQEFGFRLAGSELLLWWFWVLGADVSPDALLNTTDITEPHLLHLGPGAVLDTAVTVLGHELKGGQVRFERVRVHEGALVEAGAVLLPGAEVAAGARVPPLTAVRAELQSKQRKAGAVGLPAKPAGLDAEPGAAADAEAGPLLHPLLPGGGLLPQHSGRPLLFTAMQLAGLYAHGLLSALVGYLAYAVAAALLDAYNVTPFPLLQIEQGYVLVALCLTLSWKYFMFVPLYVMSVSGSHSPWTLLEHMGETYGVFGALWVVVPAFWAAILGAALSHAAVKWVLLGRLQPGQYVRRSVLGLCIWVCGLTMQSNYRSYYGTVMDTPLYNLLLNLLGARVALSAGFRFMQLVPSHPDMLRMGDKARFGDLSGAITSAALSPDKILVGQVLVGADSLVGATSLLLPGSCLEPGAVLGVMAAALPGQTLAGNALSLGTPARSVMPVTVKNPAVPASTHVLSTLVGAAQPAAMVLTVAISVMAGIYPYAWVGKEHGAVPAAAAAVGCFYVFGACLLLLAAALKWLLVGRLVARHASTTSFYLMRRSCVVLLHLAVGMVLGDLIQASPLHIALLRMRGTHVSWTTYFDSWIFADDDLATFHPGVVVGHNALVFCHLLFPREGVLDDMIEHKHSEFGAGCCLMPRSFALPGAQVAAGATVQPLRVAAPKRQAVNRQQQQQQQQPQGTHADMTVEVAHAASQHM